MNNKGFGLPEILIFIGCSLFILISISIYINNYNTNKTLSNTTQISDPTIVPSKVEVPDEYKKLEDKLKKISYNYKINKNENIIISLDKMKKSHLVRDLKDPNDNTISCNGYVIYKDKKYKAYISCPGMYVTNDYNSDFE